MAKLMFNSLLRAFMQTYLQMTLAMWTSLRYTNLHTSSGRIDFVLFLVTFAYALSFILFSYKFLKRNKDNLRNPQFKLKYDSLYQNLEYFKMGALSNTSFFLCRRILFAALIVFGEGYLVFQVMAADVLSTLLLIFFITQRPMIDVWNNFVQIFNELVVLVCVWFLFHYSDYVVNPETRYDLAYYFLYIVATDIVINVLFLIYMIVKKIYMACRSFF